MEKLIIFLIIFIGPMILKAIKKNSEKASPKKMFSPDIGESSSPLKNFFDLFEDNENEIQKAKEEAIIETKNTKETEKAFYEEVVDDNFEEKQIIDKSKIESREITNTLQKFDKYSYLKKGIIYKEIFDQPVSMRNH